MHSHSDVRVQGTLTGFTCLSETTLKGRLESRLDSGVREEVLCIRGRSIHGVGPMCVNKR